MKRLLFAVLLFVLLPGVALASGETPPVRSADLTYTQVQTITIPYTFEVIDFEGEHPTLAVDLANVEFINRVGSIAATMPAILVSTAILGTLLILMLAIWVLGWLFNTVTGGVGETNPINLTQLYGNNMAIDTVIAAAKVGNEVGNAARFWEDTPGVSLSDDFYEYGQAMKKSGRLSLKGASFVLSGGVSGGVSKVARLGGGSVKALKRLR